MAVEYAIYGLDEQGTWVAIYASPDRADAEGFYRRLAQEIRDRRFRLVEQEDVHPADGDEQAAP